MCVEGMTNCANAKKLLVNDDKNQIFLLYLATRVYVSLKAHSDFELLTSWRNVIQSFGAEQENAPLYIMVYANGVYKYHFVLVPFCPGL